ncbi:MAG: dephospho-CoA kinase [Candidatus Puniceispirillaceae bacterium]
MKIIGLTGSIASGKSTIARMFRQYGMDYFGLEVLAADGSVDRPALGQKIFADPEARNVLEGILHPLVYQSRQRFLADIGRAGKSFAVLDVPLLFETGGDAGCDYLITVWAPMRILRQRALRRPNMTKEKFAQIIKAQLPQSDKIRLSDLALPTSLGRAESRRRLKKWLARIR